MLILPAKILPGLMQNFSGNFHIPTGRKTFRIRETTLVKFCRINSGNAYFGGLTVQEAKCRILDGIVKIRRDGTFTINL